MTNTELDKVTKPQVSHTKLMLWNRNYSGNGFVFHLWHMRVYGHRTDKLRLICFCCMKIQTKFITWPVTGFKIMKPKSSEKTKASITEI